MSENLYWCEHIHNWGGAFYYVDSYHPFPVFIIEKDSTEKVNPNLEWKVCPICQAVAPVFNSEKQDE
jgi:hypothetical protein